MTNQITLEEALELVEFEPCPEGWRVKNVKGSVYGNVLGDVRSNVWGSVCGSVCNVGGNVGGDVIGRVRGTISGRQWRFVETPKERLKRLIEEGADKDQLLAALDRLEDSDD